MFIFSAQVQGPESDTEVEEEYAVSPDTMTGILPFIDQFKHHIT